MIVIGVVNVPPAPTVTVAVAVDPTVTITSPIFSSITGGGEIFNVTEFPVYPLPGLLIISDCTVPNPETTAVIPADTGSREPETIRASVNPGFPYVKKSALSTNT